MGYRAYPQYKNSEISWAPMLPSSWDEIAVKHGYEIQLGKMLQSSPSGHGDIEVPYLKALHVNWSGVQVEELPSMWASRTEIEKYQVKNGDLLICEGGEVGRAATLQDLAGEAIIQNAIHRARNGQLGEVGYFRYLLENMADAGWFSIICNKATIAHLTGEKLGAIKIPCPPQEQQRRIAQFLDHKTAKIDRLIGKKQELLEKLDEQRIAIITQAVTQGLDSEAPMQDSGLEWLGAIPAHWTPNQKLNFLSTDDKNSFVNGPFGSDLLTSELVSDGIPVIYSGDVKAIRFQRKSDKYVTEDKAAQLDFCRVDGGDVLLAKVGDPPGDACVYPKDQPSGIVTQDVVRIKIDEHAVDPEYLCFLLNSKPGRHLVRLVSIEATRGRFSLADLKGIRTFLPPRAEQQAIVAHIRQQIAKRETLAERVLQEIETLQEYRAALITAAVTGQIDVRDWQAPATTPEPATDREVA